MFRKKVEDVITGGIGESISHVTGTVKAFKYLIYTLTTVIVLVALATIAYGIYNLVN